MALTGNAVAIDTNETEIYDGDADGIRGTTIVVRNRATSGVDARIRIPELHGDSGYATIPPGDFQPFRIEDQGLSRVFASTGSSTASIDWWLATKTRQR